MNQNQTWRAFTLISFALCIGTMGTALASPLYPIYQELWNLKSSDITFIFVAYMFGCLTTLLFLGRTSNSIGFTKTMQIGLAFIIVGLVLSIFANDAIFLSVGRFIIGIASGLITTSALIGLVQSVPESHKSIAPQLCSIITAIGFGLGPFVGGFIAHFFINPLVTPYIPIIIGSLMSLVSLFYLKTPAFDPQPFSVSPKLLQPEPQFRSQFWIISLAAFAIFAAFSLFASLSPSFIKEILPYHGPLVSGSAITFILVISVIVQFFARKIVAIQSLIYGLCISILSLVALFICMWLKISWLFFLSDFSFGVAHGLVLLGAFGIIHNMTHQGNRAAVMSTYLFVAYLGTIIPILAVGLLADYLGLAQAVLVFCSSIGFLFLFILIKQLVIKNSQNY